MKFKLGFHERKAFLFVYFFHFQIAFPEIFNRFIYGVSIAVYAVIQCLVLQIDIYSI